MRIWRTQQAGRFRLTPDRANSRSFSPSDAIRRHCQRTMHERASFILTDDSFCRPILPTARCGFIGRGWEPSELCHSKITNVKTPAVLSCEATELLDRMDTYRVKGSRLRTTWKHLTELDSFKLISRNAINIDRMSYSFYAVLFQGENRNVCFYQVSVYTGWVKIKHLNTKIAISV